MIGKQKRKRRYIGVFVLVICLLTGCRAGGANKGDGTNTEQAKKALTEEQKPDIEQEQAEAFRKEFQSREKVDVLELEWKEREQLSNPESWWSVEQYISDLGEDHEGKKEPWTFQNYYAQDASDVYMLDTYTVADAEGEHTRYYLNHLDCETLTTKVIPLENDDMLQEKRCIIDLDAGGGKILAFIIRMNEETKELEEYFAAFINQDGTWGETIDLLPTYEQAGLKQEIGFVYSEPLWDKRGYIYLRGTNSSEIYIINTEGELLGRLNGIFDHSTYLDCRCKTPEGICIFEEQNPKDRKISYFYYDEGETKLLYGADNGFITNRYINSYGDMLFIYQGAIVCWNLVTGSYERLYIGSTGLEAVDCIVQSAEGKIITLQQENGKVSASIYSKAGPAKKVELSLMATSVMDYYTRSFVKEFERRHPGVKVDVIEPEFSDLEMEWHKLVVDLKKGEGPDLILLSRDKMLKLQENGLLADLTDVLPEDIREQVFPGVLDNGKVGDRLYSLTYAAGVSTIMASGDEWQQKTWSIQDVLDLIEKREKEGRPVKSLTNTTTNTQEGQSAGGILYYFLLDLENSPFLDQEKGECYFDSEDFRRLLQMCKKYGVTDLNPNYNLDSGAWDRQRSYVKDGQALAYVNYDSSFVRFSEDMAAFQNNFFCVGYPTEGGSGSFWNCYDGLAVNAKAENREIIDELLRFLYSEDCQVSDLMYSCVVVRKDLLADRVTEIDGTKMLRGSSNTYWELETKPDGTTYLEEYLDFLEGCVPYPAEAEEIKNMIKEEADAYFSGDKDLDTVINIIQRRVQMYLYENS